MQVESLLGVLLQIVVISLLSAESHSGDELDFPTAGGAVLRGSRGCDPGCLGCGAGLESAQCDQRR